MATETVFSDVVFLFEEVEVSFSFTDDTDPDDEFLDELRELSPAEVFVVGVPDTGVFAVGVFV